MAKKMRPLAEFRCRETDASQLVEFAVALPLLVIFVVGIFDFSGAYTLKQKLTNVAASAARTAAGDPASDLQSPSTALPASVIDTFDLIHNYFLANNLNACGITSSGTSSGLTWTFTASGNGCPTGGLTIVINRGYYFPAAAATTPSANCAAVNPGSQTAIIGTCVSITYGYQWSFGRAASLWGLSPVLPATITASAVAMNEF
jgi:Flp pilus assembly protein TadG